MSENMIRGLKCSVDKAYPEPKVERQNIQYGNILLKDYAGEVSEFTAIALYIYQDFVSENRYKDYAKLVESIAIVEMKHLELIGETILLEGIKPMYVDGVYPSGRLWTPMYVNYNTNILDMLCADIDSEKKAIANYNYHLVIIKDKYIRKLIERIILDEELHLKLFKEMLENFTK